jgi:hypothetical protein
MEIIFILDNNFGEIEMCLNEKLSYNIKVKSRTCELFVLKKNDFLRLSVNFKDFIEVFLHKSLMIYLKFNEEKKRLIKEERLKGNKLKENKQYKELKELKEKPKNQKESPLNLEIVTEEKEEVSEYDVESEYFTSNTEKSILSNENSHESVLADFKKGQKDDKRVKTIIDVVSNSVSKNFKKRNVSSDSNQSKCSSKQSESYENYENNLDSPKPHFEQVEKKENTYDKLKLDVNKKIIKKIDRIIEYLESNKIEFSNYEVDPIELLKSLKQEKNILEKNFIIDKIEHFLKNYYKRKE